MKLIDKKDIELSDKGLEDRAYAMHYIESLGDITEDDARSIIDNLKSEKAIIHHQLGMKSAEANTKDYYDADFAEWKARAKKAILIKTKQLRWLKQYCLPALKNKKEASVWATCIVLSDYILGLPEDANVPCEIVDLISQFKQSLRRRRVPLD